MTSDPELPSPGDEPPQYVAEHVRDVLAVDDRVAALDIRVRVVGRKVFLTGTIATEVRLAAVTDLVTSQLPEHEIHNELAVVDCSEVSAGEVETLT